MQVSENFLPARDPFICCTSNGSLFSSGKCGCECWEETAASFVPNTFQFYLMPFRLPHHLPLTPVATLNGTVVQPAAEKADAAFCMKTLFLLFLCSAVTSGECVLRA